MNAYCACFIGAYMEHIMFTSQKSIKSKQTHTHTVHISCILTNKLNVTKCTHAFTFASLIMEVNGKKAPLGLSSLCDIIITWFGHYVKLKAILQRLSRSK